MNRIKELRKKNRLSQTELAKEMGVHQTSVSQWEREDAMPTAEMLFRLAKFFGVTAEHLFCKEDELNNRG